MLHNGCCYTVFILDALFLLQLCLLCFAIQFNNVTPSIVHTNNASHGDYIIMWLLYVLPVSK